MCLGDWIDNVMGRVLIAVAVSVLAPCTSSPRAAFRARLAALPWLECARVIRRVRRAQVPRVFGAYDRLLKSLGVAPSPSASNYVDFTGAWGSVM